jgi:ribulose 1,5-bisphosphate carboxylase large subunit-like protein
MQIGAFVGDFVFTFVKAKQEPPRIPAREELNRINEYVESLVNKEVNGGITEPQVREKAYRVLIPFLAKYAASDIEACRSAVAFFEGEMRKKATACVLAAGIHPGLVPTLLEDFGPEIVIGAGGAIHGHPDGSRGGAKAMRQAIDAAVERIPLEEHASMNRELKIALEKWGAPKTVEESKKLYTLRK